MTGRYDPTWAPGFYDKYGDREWNRWETSPAEEVKFHIHRVFVERHVQAGDYVLEIGAGAGRFTEVLAGIGARILVADISAGQLALNREHARELGYAQAVEDWIQLDLCDMSALPENRFDAVLCYGGPLSYVFDQRDVAMGQILRVLKDGGIVLLSVMSLWGTIHQHLLGVLEVPPEENAQIIRSGDLHPETYSNCVHRNHMFRAHELRRFLERFEVEVFAMAASNCLSSTYGEKLGEIRTDPIRWAELLEMEEEACQEAGCLDLGSHMIAVARKNRAG